MTVGEIVAVTGLIASFIGVFIRYGIVLPMKNVIQPLEISIKELNESLMESREDRKQIHATLKIHDTRLTIQEQKTEYRGAQLERIEQKIDRIR